MPYLYGSIPTAFTALKSLTLTHPDFNSGNPGTVTISTSADYVGFVSAFSLLSTALSSATGADLTASWTEATGIGAIATAGAKTWSITAFPARGFFGFAYPITNASPTAGVPLGALYLEGVSVDSVDVSGAVDGRPSAGDGYALFKGETLELTAYFKKENHRGSQNIVSGAGSDIDWASYKGRISCKGATDASGFSLSNLDGAIIDAELTGYTLEAPASFMGSEIWTAKLSVQL